MNAIHVAPSRMRRFTRAIDPPASPPGPENSRIIEALARPQDVAAAIDLRAQEKIWAQTNGPALTQKGAPLPGREWQGRDERLRCFVELSGFPEPGAAAHIGAEPVSAERQFEHDSAVALFRSASPLFFVELAPADPQLPDQPAFQQ